MPAVASPRPPLRPHPGLSVLLLGLFSWLAFPPLAFGAVWLGWSALREMDAGAMDPSGRRLVEAGLALGGVMAAFQILLALALLALACLLLLSLALHRP